MPHVSHGVCFVDDLDASADFVSRTGHSSAFDMNRQEVDSFLFRMPRGSDEGGPGFVVLWSPVSDLSYPVRLPKCDPATWPGSPWTLTMAEGAEVAAAVSAVWIAAAIWRWLIRSLKDRDNE